MKSDKLIQEELERMKSLFDYERGKVVSEQNQGAGAFALAPNLQTPVAKTPSGYDLSKTIQQYLYNPNAKALVDCTGYVQIPKVAPSKEVQDDFMKKSGLNPKSEENKKYYCDADAMKSYLAQQNKSTSKTTTTAPPPIPTELKDIEGVKKFQDWLDTNKKGWASGYTNGILNKLGKGYGRMGPRTSKAWGLYKDEYLNPSEKVEPITQQEVQTINAGTQTNQGTATNTTATDTSSNVISPTPPDEPGQPGENRDGWSWDEKQQKWFKPL